MSHFERLRNAVQLWTKMYTEMGTWDVVRRHAGQARIAHASACCMFVPRDQTEVYTGVAPGPGAPLLRTGACVSAMYSLMWLSRRIRTATTHNVCVVRASDAGLSLHTGCDRESHAQPGRLRPEDLLSRPKVCPGCQGHDPGVNTTN